MSRQVIHIGLKKTGTTWLQALLLRAAADGAIAAAPLEKWISFREAHPKHTADTDSFQALGTWLSEYRNQPAFLSWENLYQYDGRSLDATIADALPGATILITTRGPEGYLQSLYNNAIINGYTELPDDFAKNISNRLLRSHNFSKLVSEFSIHHAENRLVFLPYEMLETRPRKYLKHVSELVGVDLSPWFEHRKLNVSPKPEWLELLRRISEKLESENSTILDTPEWKLLRFVYSHSNGSAKHQHDFFLRHAAMSDIKLDQEKPRLPADINGRLSDMMSPLKSIPHYGDYLDTYFPS